MSDHFYNQIVQVDSLYIAIEQMDIEKHQKQELVELVDSQLHHTILDLVLSYLSEEDKHEFLLHHARGDHDALWEHLNNRVERVEDKIVVVAAELAKKLHDDIHESYGIAQDDNE